MASSALGTAVLASSSSSTDWYVAGAAIVAGNVVYVDINDSNRIKPTVVTAIGTSRAIGVALNSAPTIGQPVRVALLGLITGTSTLVVGEPYFASLTAGQVYQPVDILAGHNVAFLGIAVSANSLNLAPFSIGVPRA